jgi:hypothetical protein
MGFFRSAGGSDREPGGNEPPGNHDAEHDLAKRTIDYLISGTAIRFPGSTKTN